MDLSHYLPYEHKKFRRRMGYDFNLEHPKSFNEKIVWKKYFDRNPLIPITADKLRVREYVREKLNTDKYSLPLIWSGDKAEDIPFDDLPGAFVVKANNASGRNRIVTGAYSRTSIITQCKKWLAADYGHAEWGYKPIQRKILIEKYLFNQNGTHIRDVKLLMFHGKCEVIQTETIIPRPDKMPIKTLRLYNPDWTVAAFQRADHNLDPVMPRPDRLDEMIAAAEKLSEPFDFVRIDFILKDNDIFISEMTHYPAAGSGAFEPREGDYYLGGKLKLKKDSVPKVFNIIPGKEPLLIMTFFWRQPNAWAKYYPEHVNRWFYQFKDNLTIPCRFACVTNMPEGINPEIQIIPEPKEFVDVRTTQWTGNHPRCYRRIPLFHPQAAKIFGASRFACTDLDVHVLKNSDSVFLREEDFIITAGSGKLESNPYNGSMVMMNAGARPKVYTHFTQELAELAAGTKEETLTNPLKFIGSDQSWYAYAMGALEATWTDKDGVYRWHPAKYRQEGGKIPDNCKIIFFPGSSKEMTEVTGEVTDFVKLNVPGKKKPATQRTNRIYRIEDKDKVRRVRML